MQQLDQIGADLHLVLTGHLGQAFHGLIGSERQALNIHACSVQQGFGSIVLLEHGEQHVGGVYICMVLTQGKGLRFAQGFLKLGG